MSGEKEERPHDEQWKLHLPTGYRFVPTDAELLRHYLFRKLNGLFIHAGIIHDADVYERNPYNLPGIDREDKYTYFFTRRERKYPNGSKTDRSTRDGKGYWKITSRNTPVLSDDNQLHLGKRSTLVYYFKNLDDPKLDHKTNWIMHEFVLDKKFFPSTSSSLAPKKQFSHFVLCRVYKRKIKGKEETDELKDLANSFIGPMPVMTHNDEEPSLKRKFEPFKETCDHPHDIAMSSNYYFYGSHELQPAAVLGNMKTNDFGQTSKTSSPSSPQIMVKGEGVSGGSSDQTEATVYQKYKSPQNPPHIVIAENQNSGLVQVKTVENDPLEDPRNMTTRRDHEEPNNIPLDLANDLAEVSSADIWDLLSRTPPRETFNFRDYFGI